MNECISRKRRTNTLTSCIKNKGLTYAYCIYDCILATSNIHTYAPHYPLRMFNILHISLNQKMQQQVACFISCICVATLKMLCYTQKANREHGFGVLNRYV